MPLYLNMTAKWKLHRDLMQRAIQGIPDSLYTPAQKAVWTGRAKEIDWENRLGSQEIFERKEGEELIAFGTLTGNNLDFLFVSPDHWGKGLGRSLIGEIEEYARNKKLAEITVEASLALFPLCLQEGFQVIEKEYISIDNEKIPRFKMTKPLAHKRHHSSVLWISERLYLREMLPIDAQACYELNRDPTVLRYTGDVAFASVEASRQFLENYDPYKKTGYGRWATIRKSDGAWIGWCGIKQHEDGKVDLGYRLHQIYWNQGYATEAARLSIELAKNEYRLDQLILEANKDNHASRRVAEKLGFLLQDSPEHAAISDVLYVKNLHE